MPEAPALNRAASTAALTQLRRAACSRTLQRRWRAWAAAQRTTSALAAAFSACGVSLRAGRRADFDAFAAALQAGATLRAARALLTRLDARLQARGVPQGDSERNALRRLFPPRAQPAAGAAGAPRRAAVAAPPPTTPSAAGPSTPAGRPRGPGGLAPAPAPADRFPARVLLCAWVIRLFPEVVLQRRSSERETALAAAAAALVDATEALVARLAPRDDVAGGGSSSDSEEQQPLNPKSIDNPGDAEPAPDVSLGSLLVCFDAAWVRYLDQFVAWKRADADALLTDLTACAAAMHTSLARKCGTAAAAAATREAPSSGTGGAPSADDVLDVAQLAGGSPDRQALLAQVRADVALLRERCAALAGAAGAERLRAALAAAAKAAAAEEAREADAAAEGNERIMHELMHDGARGDGARRGAGSGSSGGSDDDDSDEQGGRESGGWQEAEQPQPTSPRGMARRVRAALKAAFWESFSTAVAADASKPAAGTAAPPAASEAAPPVYVGVMAEMRDELASLSPAAATAALSPRLDTATSAFREALLRGDTAGAGAALREYVAAAAGALRQLGAPAREDAFDAALRRLDASAQRVALPAAAAAAMRLLFAQLARLRRDVAAAARNALAPAARGAAGAAWAAARFARRHRLPPPGAGGGAATLPAAALPRTRALLAAAARALPAADAELGAAMAAQPAPLSPAASPASPAVMLTGRMRSGPATPASPAESSGGGASPGAMPPPQGVAALRSAPALLRLGLIALLQSPPAGNGADAAGLQLPETLAFDGARLDAAAEAFQRAVLLAAAFALLPQLRGAAANASPSAPAPPASDELRERLCALLGDASTRLADVAAEVARAAGAPGDADAAERGLARLTARGEAPRAALEAALASALRAHLLLGAHRGGTAAATAALRRCGAEAAAALGDEVARLAARLERVAAVSLRVHAPLYAALAAAHLAA